MTGWMFVYMLLGALLAWPCAWLLRRVLQARHPLRCVQPYRPHLPPSESLIPPQGGMHKAP
jgi:hypothetical protein